MFTVPAEIEIIAFQNQTVVYDILFRAASETLRTIAADPKHLGAEIGFLAVLHTWGQTLMHHPHGFHRIRYFGFLGNCQRARKLARCRELLGMVPPAPADPAVDYRDRFEALTGRSLRECPHCRTGIMVVIDSIARLTVCQPVLDTS